MILSTANGRANLFYTLCERAMKGLGRLRVPLSAVVGKTRARYHLVRRDRNRRNRRHADETVPRHAREAFEATGRRIPPSIALWDARRADVPPPTGVRRVLALDAASSDPLERSFVSKLRNTCGALCTRLCTTKRPALDFDKLK